MASQNQYIEILQKIQRDYSGELTDELNEEINSLLETGETLPDSEKAARYLSILASFFNIIGNMRHWL